MTTVIRNADLSTPPRASGWLAEFGDLPTDELGTITLTIFQDVVADGGGGSYLSSPILNGLLGAFDQIALAVTTDYVTSGSTVALQAQIEHSADGRNWINKAASPEVPALFLSLTGTTTLLGLDDGTIPSLAFVRVRFDVMDGAPTQLRLTAEVTCNNTREKHFAGTIRQPTHDCPRGQIVAGTEIPVSDGIWKDPRLNYAAQNTDVLEDDVDDYKRTWWLPFFDVEPWGEEPNSGWATLREGYSICFAVDGSLTVFEGLNPVLVTTIATQREVDYWP